MHVLYDIAAIIVISFHCTSRGDLFCVFITRMLSLRDLLFTALYVMQTRYSDENLCPSVRHTREL